MGFPGLNFFDSCGAESLIEEAPGDFEFLADPAINCCFDGSCIEKASAGITPPVTEMRESGFCLIDINGTSSFAFFDSLGAESLIEDAPGDYDLLADATINCTFDGSIQEGCVTVTSHSLSEIPANIENLLVLEAQPNSSWSTDGMEGEWLVSTEATAWSRKKEKNKCPASVKRCITSKAVAMKPYMTTHVGSKINMNSLAERTSLASNNANKWRWNASMKGKHRTTFGASFPALASSLSSRNLRSSVKEVEGIPVLIKNKTQSKSAALLKAIKSSQNASPGKLSRPKNFTSKLPVPARNLVAKSLALVAEINKLSCLKDDSVSQSKGSCSTSCTKDVKFIKERIDGGRGMKKSSIPDTGGSRQRLMTVPIKSNDIRFDNTGKISCQQQHSSRKKKECTAPSVNNHTMLNKRVPILNKKVPSTGKGIVVVEKSSALSRRKQRRFKDDLINGTKPASVSKEKKIKSKLRTTCEDASAGFFSQTGAINNKEGEWLFNWEEACRWRAEIMSNIINKEEWLDCWDEACRWRHERMEKEGEWLFSWDEACKWRDERLLSSRKICGGSTACSKDLQFIKKRIDGRGMKKSSIPDSGGGSRQRLMRVPIKHNDSRCEYTGKISCQHSSRKKKECTAPSVNNHTILNKRAPFLNKKVPSTGKGMVVVEKSLPLSRRKQRRFKDDVTNGTKSALISKELKIKSKLRTTCEDASEALFSQTGAINNKDGEWLFSWEEACRWRAERMAKEKDCLFSWDEACKWRNEL